MAETMTAGRLNFETKKFDMKQIPIPVPQPGEVRVRVRAAGVCLSDVHLIRGVVVPPQLALTGATEVTLGHEVAGEVELLGDGVTGVAAGDRVIVGAATYVGGRRMSLGVDFDGGWAEYVVVPAEALVPIPDTLPFEQAAIIPDAVTTSWGAIEWTRQVRAGESVGVWGVGGLGVHGIQLLRFIGATPIVAIDPVAAARDRAVDFGADLALDPGSADFSETVERLTSGRGLDVAFDFAGIAPVRQQALNSLTAGGRLVVVGISGGPLVIENDLAFQFARKQVLGHYGSQPHHISELVRLIEFGRLDFSRSVSATRPLAEAAEAVEQLESKEGNPIRIVLIP